MLGQSFDLLDIKDGVSLHEGYRHQQWCGSSLSRRGKDVDLRLQAAPQAKVGGTDGVPAFRLLVEI
jgi:hypothetical protein